MLKPVQGTGGGVVDIAEGQAPVAGDGDGTGRTSAEADSPAARGEGLEGARGFDGATPHLGLPALSLFAGTASEAVAGRAAQAAGGTDTANLTAAHQVNALKEVIRLLPDAVKKMSLESICGELLKTGEVATALALVFWGASQRLNFYLVETLDALADRIPEVKERAEACRRKFVEERMTAFERDTIEHMLGLKDCLEHNGPIGAMSRERARNLNLGRCHDALRRLAALEVAGTPKSALISHLQKLLELLVGLHVLQNTQALPILQQMASLPKDGPQVDRYLSSSAETWLRVALNDGALRMLGITGA